jgi:phage shock protein PspC (stress-responsive transcriptional regulator)
MSEHSTHTQSLKRLERSSSDRVLAGVAGGLGQYFDLNPNFFRLGFVVLTLLGGAGILVYLAALLVIPDEGKEQSIAAAAIEERRDRPWPLVGLGLAGVALAVLLSRAWFWPSAGIGWVLVLLAGLAILWSRDEKRGHRRAHLLLIWLLGLAVAAIVVLAAATAVAFAWFDVSLGDGVGSKAVAPTSAADLDPSYELGIGNLRLDLSNVTPLDEQTHVTAKVGIGKLRIIVPRGVPVEATATSKAGEVYVLGRHDDGRHATASVGTGGELVVDAKVGAGRVDIVRAQTP